MGEKQDWESLKKQIQEINYIGKIKQISIQKLSAAMLQKIQERVESFPDFRPKNFKSLNNSGRVLCDYVNTVYQFNKAQEKIADKRAQYEQMEKVFSQATADVQEKKRIIQNFQQEIELKEGNLRDTQVHLQDSKDLIKLTKTRMDNIHRIIDIITKKGVKTAEEKRKNNPKLFLPRYDFTSTQLKE